MSSNIYLSFVTLVVLATICATQDINKTIHLNKTLTQRNKELFADFIYLNKSSTLEVSFTDINENVTFIIFQVHSHFYNITLTNTNNGYSVNGMNVGLYSSVTDLATFKITNTFQVKDLKLFVAVLGYGVWDPIPGGCSFDTIEKTQKLPNMKLFYNKANITVKASQAKCNRDDDECTSIRETGVEMKFYMLYLPEYNFDSEAYFSAISNMTTIDNIEKNGYELPPQYGGSWAVERMVSAYPGAGAVFVVVANDTLNYTVYVPTQTYACSPLVDHDCAPLEDSYAMFLSVVLFFLGIGMCYFGHWFFKTQIVAMGFLSGSIVCYIIVSLLSTINSPDIVIAATISGLCIGGIRLVCWWLFGIPALVIFFSCADVGFLLASFCYYLSPGGTFLQSDTTFWSYFVLIVLVTAFCLIWAGHIASIVCSGVIGGYTAIYPLDYYMGSSVKYIVNNVVRRATVPGFNKAIIHPPCQWRDVFLLVIWALLSVSGILYQLYYSKGRAPFPPPPRSVRALPEPPVVPIMRRRSSVVMFWSIWVNRCRQRRTPSFIERINESTPLLEED